jgi:HSP20 family molecular chaperone IbpA
MDLMKWKDRPSQDSWNNLRSLQKEINALFDDDFFPASAGLFDRTFSPAVDLVEQADNYLVTCELPGMENSDIDVQVADNVLTIKGEKNPSLRKTRRTGSSEKPCTDVFIGPFLCPRESTSKG